MWLAFCAVFLVGGCLVEGRKGYILTAPKVFLAGARENVCIRFHDVSSDLTIKYNITSLDKYHVYLTKTLKIRADISRTKRISSADIDTNTAFKKRSARAQRDRCVNLRIPKIAEPVDRALFMLSGEDRSGYRFSNNKIIGIKHKSIMVFIQTDKPIYKPGQNVRIRTISLTYDLKPLPKYVLQIDLLYVENPTKIRMIQWSEPGDVSGILDFEMPLSENPVLGTWKVIARLNGTEYSRTFEVLEYVLPKFEIVIKPQPYLLWKDEEIKGEICANYTYGKPVHGELKFKACITYDYDLLGQESLSDLCYQQVRQIKGCVRFNVTRTNADMRLSRHSNYNTRLSVFAAVTETATGVVLNASNDDTKLETTPLRLEIESPNYFKPGLSYYGRVKVSKPDGSAAPGELVRLKFSANQTTLSERLFHADINGIVHFDLPSMPREIIKVSLLVTALWHRDNNDIFPSRQKELTIWYSRNGRYIQIKPIYTTVTPGDYAEVNVTFTTQRPDSYLFYYEVQSMGNIVLAKTFNHKVGGSGGLAPYDTLPGSPLLAYVDHHILKFSVKTNMSPKLHLVVFYITDDGEVIADSTDIDVQEYLKNQVTMEIVKPTTESEVTPGSEITFKLTAAKKSVCAIGVVDKSVHLLGGNGQLNVSHVFSKLRRYQLSKDSGPYQRSSYCDKVRSNSRAPDIHYGWRYVSVDDYVDSTLAFKNIGMLSMSDLDVESRPCWREKRYDLTPPPSADKSPRGMSGRDGAPGLAFDRWPGYPPRTSDVVEPQVVELRKYFPETWLWELKFMSSKEVTLRRTLPDTNTEWVGNAFCNNWKTGLGISPPVSIRAFKAFFVSFTLPYSVVRGERVHMPVTVFNYLSECLVIKLEMKSSTQYEVLGDMTTHLCVCGSESKTQIYIIKFSGIGNRDVSVEGISVTKSGVCGDNQITRKNIEARDGVSRQLLVEADGKPEDYSFNDFICVDNGDEQTVEASLPLPGNLVPDSARADVSVMGNVLGPAVAGLDHLLKLPTGCGEQTMLNFAPNIYILQYLDETNQLTDELDSYAIGFLTRGYQRELTYKHLDGSYSAFGTRDNSGSTWLTAFVVKCFAQAKHYITIDQKDLNRTINWFRNIQETSSGCFQKRGRIIHKSMKGGLHKGASSAVTLTSYTLISLLEAGISTTDPLVTNAIRCLDSYSGSDTYTITTMAYAYTLWNPNSPQKARIMAKLNRKAITEGGMKHWSRGNGVATGHRTKYHREASVDIEMTAYALLAHIAGAGMAGVPAGNPIVKWLSKQRNFRGGFASTQDTVVALQALAQFAELTYSDDIELTVEVEGEDLEDVQFDITNTNTLVVQREEITVPNDLTFIIQGHGCALIQANVRYSTVLETDGTAFYLNASAALYKSCNESYINICTRYSGPDESSNMAIVAVKMVSGWSAERNSLMTLLRDYSLDLKKFEVDQNMVNFYFEELTSEVKCFRFKVTKFMLVTDTKPANIEVYDYYDTDLSATMSYRIREC